MVHLCLLRGINVSGHNMIKMEALKTTLEAIGFQNVQTYIQSGNILTMNEGAQSLWFCAPHKKPILLFTK